MSARSSTMANPTASHSHHSFQVGFPLEPAWAPLAASPAGWPGGGGLAGGAPSDSIDAPAGGACGGEAVSVDPF